MALLSGEALRANTPLPGDGGSAESGTDLIPTTNIFFDSHAAELGLKLLGQPPIYRDVAKPRWSNLAFWAAASVSWLLVAAPPLDGYAVRLILVSIVLGVAGRGAFVKLSPRSDDLTFISPWIIVLALGFAIALSPLREIVELNNATGTELASTHGLVKPGAIATASDRCVGRQLEEASASAAPPAHEKVMFYRAVCKAALNRSILLESGVVLDRKQLEAIKLQVRASG